MPSTYLIRDGTQVAIDLLGPTIMFLTSPTEPNATYCMMKGTIPPGVQVPLHSHPDDESFFMLSGTVQVLCQTGDLLEWLQVTKGGFVHIPAGNKHAFRNMASEPVVQLITTTCRLGRFFQEVGRSVQPGEVLLPPTPDDWQHFAQVATTYNHWLGSAEENAAVGIQFGT